MTHLARALGRRSRKSSPSQEEPPWRDRTLNVRLTIIFRCGPLLLDHPALPDPRRMVHGTWTSKSQALPRVKTSTPSNPIADQNRRPRRPYLRKSTTSHDAASRKSSARSIGTARHDLPPRTRHRHGLPEYALYPKTAQESAFDPKLRGRRQGGDHAGDGRRKTLESSTPPSKPSLSGPAPRGPSAAIVRERPRFFLTSRSKSHAKSVSNPEEINALTPASKPHNYVTTTRRGDDPRDRMGNER